MGKKCLLTQSLALTFKLFSAVAKLLALALRTAGAELCLLVLEKGGILCAEAVATSNSSEVKHLRRVDAIDVQPDRCKLLPG